MNVRDTLLLEYSHLADGETAAGQLCPACRGGSTGERSLSVSRDGDSLLWKCHRASCGFGGGSGSKATSYRTQTPSTKGIVGRTYYRAADPLPAEVAELLESKYYLSANQLRLLMWDADAQRVALPVLNSEGELTGCVLRSESGEQPKALSYNEDNAVAVFRNYSSPDLIIVEDIYSALRASQYINAAALLGTHLNYERMAALKSLKCKRNYLALDADAFDKTIKYVREFRNDLTMIPVKLEKDLKNHPPDELNEFFNGL